MVTKAVIGPQSPSTFPGSEDEADAWNTAMQTNQLASTPRVIAWTQDMEVLATARVRGMRREPLLLTLLLLEREPEALTAATISRLPVRLPRYDRPHTLARLARVAWPSSRATVTTECWEE